jgi:hypothetical protein
MGRISIMLALAAVAAGALGADAQEKQLTTSPKNHDLDNKRQFLA